MIEAEVRNYGSLLRPEHGVYAYTVTGTGARASMEDRTFTVADTKGRRPTKPDTAIVRAALAEAKAYAREAFTK